LNDHATAAASFLASLVICGLLAALLVRFLRAPPYDVLFVLHDAGESLSVQHALAALAADGTLRIAVLALGEPARSLFTHAANVTVYTPKQLGITTRIVDGAHRNATLSAVDVALLLAVRAASARGAARPPPLLDEAGRRSVPRYVPVPRLILQGSIPLAAASNIEH